MLPDIDGWSVLAALKADPALFEIPVVMLTIVDEATRGYSLGATDYLIKPVDRTRLLTIVRRYVKAGDKPSILLVEDEDDSRKLIEEMLEGVGCRVVEARNGKLALERLEDTDPDLILLDLMMPEMDGFDFLTALRGNPAWRDVPVVVVTARDLSEADQRRLSGAVHQVLRKGAFTGTDLLKEIRAAIRNGLDRRAAKDETTGTSRRPGPHTA